MLENLFQLVLAVLVGGIIGLERDYRHGIGLRTLMLVCLGATLFTIYSDLPFYGIGDPRRITAAVVTGVGFLGAGVILREQGRILGLTTAAAVWVVAALGVGIGVGLYVVVAAGASLVLVVLWGVPRLASLTRAQETVTYAATCALDLEMYDELTSLFGRNNLHINSREIAKRNDRMVCIWQVHGRPINHEQVTAHFLTHPMVIEFDTSQSTR